MQLMKKQLVGLILIFSVAIGAVLGFALFSGDIDLSADSGKVATVPVDLPVVPVEEAFPHVIPPRSTLFQVMRDLEVPAPLIQQIVEAAKPVQNLAKLPAGVRFQITYDKETTPQVEEVRFRFSAIESLVIKKENGAWAAHKVTERVDVETVTFSGTVTSSLWESAVKAQMDPDLISELADIFGWEVDFARAVRVGDKWRLTVEKKTVKGTPVGWGSILAAEYVNDGESHKAALFRLDGEEVGYFTPAGESLRKIFLKSPIRYARITSGFSRRRFHPKLLIFRPHQGVDYGAPTGTPVRAVGDGTVVFAGRNGGAGNMIKIRHNATYQTAYKHLNGYAKGVRTGARIQQGQVIGFVGSTGLSTGPHLHFEFYQNNQYIDPLGKRFPSADPVPKAHLESFKSSAQVLLSALPPWSNDTTVSTDRVPATPATTN
jgi:murein DD-endopeptidase MepM/ murein hydrolase activator NlpD